MAMPRSGTHVVQKIISWMFGIPNLQEPFNDTTLGFDPINSVCHINPYTWTAGVKQGVFKLLAQNLNYIDTKKLLSVGKIDHSILMERSNHADCCVSTYYAIITGKYHHDHPIKGERFECPVEYVRRWLKHYYRFQAAKECLVSSGKPYSIVNYEDFVLDKIQHVAGHLIQSSKAIKNAQVKTISTNLPYDQLCVNYQQVQELIASKPTIKITYKLAYMDS